MALIPVERAFALILEHTPQAPIVRVPLTEALGHYLAEDVLADRDLPPFDRCTVDGYAVLASDTRSAPDVLEVIEEVAAGASATKPLKPGQAIRIMTGAPLPPGADAVIMQERTSIPRPGYVCFEMKMRSGQNVSPRGEDARTGQAVLTKGAYIGTAEVGILATVGCAQVPVLRKPTIAVLGTGNDLVEPSETPGAAQIRNSNSYQLLTQCAANHFAAKYLGVARDEREQTRKLIETGLESDVLISTGGVSVGAHDHVGASLTELGVDIRFDKIAVKPGKPPTFGVRGDRIDVGLPGNPVAALVCFHLFVMTALRQRMGAADPLPRWIPLPIATDLKASGDRPTFRPCKLTTKDGLAAVAPLEWHGSGHLAALAGADGLFVQRVDTELKAGDVVSFYPF